MQYHRRQLLDDRVRDENGYGQLPMITGNTVPGAGPSEVPDAGMWERGEPVGSGVDDLKVRVNLLPCTARRQPKLRGLCGTWRKVVKPVVRLVPVG